MNNGKHILIRELSCAEVVTHHRVELDTLACDHEDGPEAFHETGYRYALAWDARTHTVVLLVTDLVDDAWSRCREVAI